MKRSTLYKALRGHSAQLDYKKLYVDLQKGQMDRPKKNYPIPLPALFIELGDFRFKPLLEESQKGSGTITLYLYQDIVSDTFKGAERENQTTDLLDHFDDLYQTFEGFSIDGITPLVRETEYKPQYGERYILFKIDFSTSIDTRRITNKKTAHPEPDIIPKYKF